MTQALKLISSLLLFTVSSIGVAENSSKTYKKTENDDRLELIEVVKNVYALVGPLGNRSPENLGNNATFGFIVTTEGIVLIDPGGTYLGAKKIHNVIKTVSDQPVKYVINTGGQDHRWLGNDYFKKSGAKVIASKEAVKDQKARFKDILFRLSNTAGDKALAGTNESFADIVFENDYKLELGEHLIEIHYSGGAHSPGDSFVWLPKLSVIFTGDVVYLDRLLSVMSFSNSKSWLAAFEKLESFNPKYVVPGHGKPASMTQAREETFSYLSMLRNNIEKFMDEGGVIQDVSKIDQSNFKYLENYELLKGRNIQQVYQEMEWE